MMVPPATSIAIIGVLMECPPRHSVTYTTINAPDGDGS
jgi:hypothetical protein